MNGPAAQPHAALTGTDFTGMTPKVLVVVGEKDWNASFSDRQDWRGDAYTAAPGPKTLPEIFDAERRTRAHLGLPAQRALPRGPGVDAGHRGARRRHPAHRTRRVEVGPAPSARRGVRYAFAGGGPWRSPRRTGTSARRRSVSAG
ncbi:MULTISPECIES: hypothetical protein [Nonomuraea]|uniref:Uncharacterized protein n=1 Tax=Nonomuraea salmonea TaxID=46181 RepID=A0ABV5NTP0_9ACTN